jgi:hypothetical protein
MPPKAALLIALVFLMMGRMNVNRFLGNGKTARWFVPPPNLAFIIALPKAHEQGKA